MGTSAEKGGSATLRNSSSVSLPSLLASSSSNDFMRYFRNSARVTSPFLSVSISTNHCGSGTGGGVPTACWAGGAPGAAATGRRSGRLRLGRRRRLGGLRRLGGWGGLVRRPIGRPACVGGVCAAGGRAATAAVKRIGLKRRFIGGKPALRGVARIGGNALRVNVRAADQCCGAIAPKSWRGAIGVASSSADRPSWLAMTDSEEGSQVLGRQG